MSDEHARWLREYARGLARAARGARGGQRARLEAAAGRMLAAAGALEAAGGRGYADYAGVEEVAGRLDRHPETVRRLMRMGRLPGVLMGGRWMMERGELEALAGRLGFGRGDGDGNKRFGVRW